MTELTQQPKHALPEAVDPVGETTEPAPVDVEALAQEATQAREDADAAKTRGDTYFEALKLATMQQAAGDVVQAISDMPADDERYYDDAGFPSKDGIRAVALELVDAKPYLGRVRGNVEQGAKESRVETTWSDVFRQAVGNV